MLYRGYRGYIGIIGIIWALVLGMIEKKMETIGLGV